MTNYNKINLIQKSLLADYMEEHSNLAKNILPNCSQGRATSDRLWKTLSNKLNAEGPPIKTEKAWRKVFTDQKYQAKKKLTFNKRSLNKTGGGCYEQKILTANEEKIIEASGLEATVEGLKSVNTFGASSSSSFKNGSEHHYLVSQDKKKSNATVLNVQIVENIDENFVFEDLRKEANDILMKNQPNKQQCADDENFLFEEVVEDEDEDDISVKNQSKGKQKKKDYEDSKFKLLKDNLDKQNECISMLSEKFDKFLILQEKLLKVEERRLEIEELNYKLKEREFQNSTERYKVDLANKCLELEILKTANDLKLQELNDSS